MKKETINIGDTIHYTFKQEKPYSKKGKVTKFRRGVGQRAYEVDGENCVVFRDEVTKVEKKN